MKNINTKDSCIKNDVLIRCTNKILLATFFSILTLSSIVSASQITVSTNRFVVLDDSDSTIGVATGFFRPEDMKGGSWNTNYWYGESTTIRSVTLVTDVNGSPQPNIDVYFKLKFPNGTQVGTTTSSVTNDKGLAYYSYDLNGKNYWGYWKIEANATVEGTNVQNSTSFALNWWGCTQCHGSEDPGKWGIMYTPKSYYTMGYDFHKSSDKSKHIEPMTKGNCITCHTMYNGTPIDRGYTDNTPTIYNESEYSPDWHNGKVKCQDCHAGSNLTRQSGTGQGKNPDIAGCYDTIGCHIKKNTNVSRVNSTTGYVIGGSYRTNYSDIQNNNVAKAHNDSRVECILCHNAGHVITKPYNAVATSNSYTENNQCWSCHTNRLNTHQRNDNCVTCHSQDAHNISVAGGGPDCISCHNIGGVTIHEVDVNAIALGEHANLNSGAIATGVPVANKKCWACHQTGGIQPTADSMGDRYTNPYKCYDCHGDNKPYNEVIGALTVSEHFKNGADIKAAESTVDNSSSCILCHNLPEMKISYTDNEFSDYSLASHYGKNRSDLRIGDNTSCIYCHQNISTVFSNAMANTDNDNMSNHSTSGTTPVCTTCHGSGKLHDSSLSKPTDSSDTYCKSCHFAKKEHKALYCTECHANNTDGSKAGRDIHGIKFLQNDNTFSQSRTNVADCITCHQDTGIVESSLGVFWPYKIGTLHHSDIINNGSKWGNYWTSGSIEACLYCHNDTKHSDTPLGRLLIWNTSYEMYTTIGSGTNCADCHYKKDSVYNAMKLTFEARGLEIPPEITNGSWNGISGYFNHSLSSYTDSQCQSCHNVGSTTVGEMMHNTSVGGAGGDTCIECHGTNYTGANPIVTQTFVDIGAYNNSVHQNINTTPINTLNNNDCWSCHYNKDMNRQNVRKCGYCHNKVSQWHGNADITTNLTELTIR